VNECRVRLNIELKYYGHDDRLEQHVVELVDKHQMQSDVVIMSLEYDGIQEMRSIRPDWKIGLLSAVAVGDLTKLDADFLAVNLGLASRAFVRSAHRSGKEVYVWTVNDPITMSAMMGRGVDSIITDEPALARSVRQQRAGMSPVERLLVELAVLFGVTPETNLTIDDV
jgi:glycerophosphoryl diester phosphodiesterase